MVLAADIFSTALPLKCKHLWLVSRSYLLTHLSAAHTSTPKITYGSLGPLSLIIKPWLVELRRPGK